MLNDSLASRLTGKQFILKRSLLKLIGAEYFVQDPNGGLLLLAHQKGFKLKEEITVYTDQQKTNPVMKIMARQVIDFSASYDVTDAVTNERIGVLKRKGMNSIVRDEWEVCDANEVPIGQLIEDSLLLSLVRRLLSNLVPQNYDLLVQGQRVVDFKQNFNPFSYHLVVDIEGAFDSRLAVASAILLAAIEGKQRG